MKLSVETKRASAPPSESLEDAFLSAGADCGGHILIFFVYAFFEISCAKVAMEVSSSSDSSSLDEEVEGLPWALGNERSLDGNQAP